MPTFAWDDIFENAGAVDEDEVVPAGKYLAEVETGEWTTSSTGKAMFKFRMRIKSGPMKSRALFNNITISPDSPMALQIGLRHLAALGLTREVLKSMTDSEQADFVVGRELEVETAVKKYKGDDRSEVKDMKPSSGSAVASATPPAADSPPPAADTPPPSTSTPPPAPFAG